MSKKLIGAGVAGALYLASPSQAEEPTWSDVHAISAQADTLKTMLADSTFTGLGRTQAEADLKRLREEADRMRQTLWAREDVAATQALEAEAAEARAIKPSVEWAIAQGNKGSARVGFRRGKFSLVGSYTQEGEDSNEETATLPRGRSAVGVEREVDASSYGLDLEAGLLQVGRGEYFAGAGIRGISFTREVAEKLFTANGDLIDANESSSSGHSRNSARAYGGVETRAGNSGISLRVFGGYDQERGGFGGIGIKYSPQKTTPRQ